MSTTNDPSDHDAQRAIQHCRRGEFAQANAICRQALARSPRHPVLLQILSDLCYQAGDMTESRELLTRLVAVQPQNAVALNNLGELLRQQGQLQAAVSHLQRAQACAPQFPEPSFNLGNTLKQLGQIEPALAAYRHALKLKPDHAKAQFNLANLLREEGRIVTAAPAYERALEIKPNWNEAHINLAHTYSELGEVDRSLSHYQIAARNDPQNSDLHYSIGLCEVSLGRTEAARAAFRRAAELKPENPLLPLRTEVLCETIAPSAGYIAEYQAKLRDTLAAFAGKSPVFPLDQLLGSGVEPPMLLTYHGGDVRPLLEAYARLFAATIPPFDPPERRRGGKPKVGIVVTHGHEGVFARCWSGLAKRLSRKDLEVRILCSRAGANVLSFMTELDRSEFLVLPGELEKAARLVRDEQFDLLHYWEIGTDATNYFLPFFRPAARQSGTWGWPVTSGNDRVDFYVSCDRFEHENSQSLYTEQLVRLRELPSYYDRPPVPEQVRSREQLGLPTAGHIYLCTQNLRKYHPDFDALLAGILRGDPTGRIVIVADSQPGITRLLVDRLRREIPDVADRVQVHPRLEREDYLHVVARADVLLDTPHYGGGANTIFDACAVGTPLVTWPGPYHRGRWAEAVYTQIGVPEAIARTPADYVARALQFAADRDLNQSLRRRIAEAGRELFANQKTVDEHTEWMLRVCAE